MKLRIAVGYDDREQSRDALELARQFANVFQVELSVAAVLKYDPLLPLDLNPYEAALAERFDEILGSAAEQLGDAQFESHRLTGPSPARELTKLAEQLEVDLLIVGSAHRGPLGRVYPGSVGASLVSGAHCPVAVAPRGFASRASRPIGTIGVGFDARPEAEAALLFAGALGAGLGAQLRLIAAVSYRPSLADELANPLDVRAVERERLTDAIATLVPSPNVEVAAAEVVDGYPATILIERSEQLDLLVLGSRGYGPLRSVMLGGVAMQVIRKAHCPVIVVPRGAASDGGHQAGAAPRTTG